MTTPDLVQVYNPRADRYVKIDRASGTIVGYTDTSSPFPGLPLVEAPVERLARELHDVVFAFGKPIPAFDELTPVTQQWFKDRARTLVDRMLGEGG